MLSWACCSRRQQEKFTVSKLLGQEGYLSVNFCEKPNTAYTAEIHLINVIFGTSSVRSFRLIYQLSLSWSNLVRRNAINETHVINTETYPVFFTLKRVSIAPEFRQPSRSTYPLLCRNLKSGYLTREESDVNAVPNVRNDGSVIVSPTDVIGSYRVIRTSIVSEVYRIKRDAGKNCNLTVWNKSFHVQIRVSGNRWPEKLDFLESISMGRFKPVLWAKKYLKATVRLPRFYWPITLFQICIKLNLSLDPINTLICKSTWFCERFTWNPAESPACDVSRQLNVLHQAWQHHKREIQLGSRVRTIPEIQEGRIYKQLINVCCSSSDNNGTSEIGIPFPAMKFEDFCSVEEYHKRDIHLKPNNYAKAVYSSTPAVFHILTQVDCKLNPIHQVWSPRIATKNYRDTFNSSSAKDFNAYLQCVIPIDGITLSSISFSIGNLTVIARDTLEKSSPFVSTNTGNLATTITAVSVTATSKHLRFSSSTSINIININNRRHGYHQSRQDYKNLINSSATPKVFYGFPITTKGDSNIIVDTDASLPYNHIGYLIIRKALECKEEQRVASMSFCLVLLHHEVRTTQVADTRGATDIPDEGWPPQIIVRSGYLNFPLCKFEIRKYRFTATETDITL
ncbi:hypothetical protein CLF_101661 [Clonorchis sinensis]|uniref:Uncharacterized protein n=1 Tax=Clonorchis sinensis TaxID=79923 RepID=G7Y694_CLOSI|nr:hypothetical protein CLF_101661 [Clonorchis sinensis]